MTRKSAKKTEPLEFLREIEDVEVSFNPKKCVMSGLQFEGCANVEFNGDVIFAIGFTKTSYELCMNGQACDFFKDVYVKSNRKLLWSYERSEQKAIIRHIEKIIGEIKEYNTAKGKAGYASQTVEELATIVAHAFPEKSPVDEAHALLSEGKPVVAIEYDGSKRKFRAKCTWQGQTLWCKFPSKYRAQGASYVVDGVVEQNGCWSVVGEIKPLCG
jgi:hypothetical protein